MNVLSKIFAAIQDAVKEAGEHGAPSGVIYSALMAHGVSLETYNILIDLMVSRKMIRKQGNLLFSN